MRERRPAFYVSASPFCPRSRTTGLARATRLSQSPANVAGAPRWGARRRACGENKRGLGARGSTGIECCAPGWAAAHRSAAPMGAVRVRCDEFRAGPQSHRCVRVSARLLHGRTRRVDRLRDRQCAVGAVRRIAATLATGRTFNMPLDGHSSAPSRSHGTLVLVGLVLAFAFGAVALAVLAGHGASTTWIDGGYWALGIAMAAAIALAAGMHPNTTVSPLFGGLAMATDTISAAFFLALAGAIFAWGHDGLAFALGLGAGCLLLQLVVAPRLPQSGAHSLPAYFARRYPGRATRFLGAVVVTLSMLALIVAELMAAGLAGARLLEVDFSTAAIVAACAVFACFVLRGMSGASWVNGVLLSRYAGGRACAARCSSRPHGTGCRCRSSPTPTRFGKSRVSRRRCSSRISAIPPS